MPVMTIDTLAPAFAAEFAAQPPGEAAARSGFLAQVVDDYRPEELPDLDDRDLAAVLAEFWRFGSTAAGPGATVRLRPAMGAGGRSLGLDLLEIAQPDSVFLVDSVMAAVTGCGAEVHAMFHPVVNRERDRWSMIQVWLSPVPDERRNVLIQQTHAAMVDVRLAVADFKPMLSLLDRTIEQLTEMAPREAPDLGEDIEFLRWLKRGHFVFLGARVYTYPRDAAGGYADEQPDFAPEDGLGVLRDPMRLVLRRRDEPNVLSPDVRYRMDRPDPVIVAKATLPSRVYRRGPMDYIGVRQYGVDGSALGEVRFVGLFTPAAYHEPIRETPMLRSKTHRVMQHAGFPPGSHNATRLASILETYPRDELFQVRADELLTMALDVLHLSDRPRFKIFVRHDPFGRFVSILFFAPRDRYDARLRLRAGEILAEAFGGRIASAYPSFSDSPLARVHFVLQLTPRSEPAPAPDLLALEAQIARAARTWSDDFEAALRAAITAPGEAARAFQTYGQAFPAGYRDRQSVDEALVDMAIVDLMASDAASRVRAYRRAGDGPSRFRFKFYRRGHEPAPLSRILPILSQMGLNALTEEGLSLIHI